MKLWGCFYMFYLKYLKLKLFCLLFIEKLFRYIGVELYRKIVYRNVNLMNYIFYINMNEF